MRNALCPCHPSIFSSPDIPSCWFRRRRRNFDEVKLAMKNAHARFGRLEFTRQMRDTTTEVRLAMDRFIGEADEKGRAGRAHLASVLGGDQDVGAVWAGV